MPRGVESSHSSHQAIWAKHARIWNLARNPSFQTASFTGILVLLLPVVPNGPGASQLAQLFSPSLPTFLPSR